MPYIERDKDNNILALYARSQEGYATEFLKEEHQEVVKFRKELKWADIRRRRNLLLESSGWTQDADVRLPSSRVAQWKAYRQKLRDLPQHYKDPDDVKWPKAPGE